MRFKFAPILLVASILCGSSAAFGQKLYPVRGPLATLSSPPVIDGKTKKGMISEKLVAWVFPNGDVLHLDEKPFGWAVAFANKKTPGAPESYPPQPNLAFAWDVVYGQGYYVANVLGSKNVGAGVFTGDKGAILQIEFLRSEAGAGSGVAVDNQGNIYKMIW